MKIRSIIMAEETALRLQGETVSRSEFLDAMHAQAEAMNRHDAMLHALTSEMKSLQDLISGHPGLIVKITIQAMEY